MLLLLLLFVMLSCYAIRYAIHFAIGSRKDSAVEKVSGEV